MMNRIMNIRVAAVALAASALIAAPAAADPVTGALAKLETQLGGNTHLTVTVGHRDHRDFRYQGHHSRGLNQWGQSRWEVRRLRRDALQECRAEISRVAWRIGFRDVDFDDDRRIRQIAPYGFRITYDDVEFEGRRREFERDVTCVVRRGDVTRLEGVPEPGRYRAGRGYDDDYRRGYTRAPQPDRPGRPGNRGRYGS